jgi:DnaK suppressor protein
MTLSKGHELLAPERLEVFKNLLLARRTALMGDVQQIEKEEAEAAGGESAGSIPATDLGIDRAATDVSLGCLETATHEIQAIDKALKRIESGSYGLCGTCGQKIPGQRLEAIPYAEFCIVCQTNEEHS